jgi:hypothetical protein
MPITVFEIKEKKEEKSDPTLSKKVFVNTDKYSVILSTAAKSPSENLQKREGLSKIQSLF